MHQSVMPQVLLAMALIAFAALLYLIQASQTSVLEYNIAYLQAQQAQLNAINADLHAQVTALQSPQRIDTVATSQLHMTQPDISTAIWVSPILPKVASLRAPSADTVDAQQASRPLAWIEHALTVARASL